jgi:hypothetical protein
MTTAAELKARKATIAFVVSGYLTMIMCGYGILFQQELARRHQIEVERQAQYIERLRSSLTLALKAALMEEEDDNPAPRKKRRPSRYNCPVPSIMATPPPPNIANAAANLVVNKAAPIVLTDPLVLQAARTAKRRRIIESLEDVMVTEVEYDAIVYEHHTAVTAAAAVAPPGAVAVPPDAPAWAGPLFDGINNLNNSVNNLTNSVNTMNNTLNNLTNTVNSMNNTLNNVEARSLNNVSTDQDDTLTALRNAAGNIPANLPPTLGALNAMNDPALTAFASALRAAQGGTRGIAPSTITPEAYWNPSVNDSCGHTFTADEGSHEPQQKL